MTRPSGRRLGSPSTLVTVRRPLPPHGLVWRCPSEPATEEVLAAPPRLWPAEPSRPRAAGPRPWAFPGLAPLVIAPLPASTVQALYLESNVAGPFAARLVRTVRVSTEPEPGRLRVATLSRDF